METDHPVVRRLTADDVPLAEQLNRLFAEVFEDHETYQGQRPGPDYLSELLAKDDLIAVVAISDGELVGGLVAYEFAKFESARREIYIYDLGVRATHRRRGIATALIKEVRQIARARGAWVIFVQADYGDEPAIALYRKLGVQEEVLHFDIAP